MPISLCLMKPLGLFGPGLFLVFFDTMELPQAKGECAATDEQGFECDQKGFLRHARQSKRKRLARAQAFCFGSPTWARTRDLRINSPVLYQLSYRGKSQRFYTNSKSPADRLKYSPFLVAESLSI